MLLHTFMYSQHRCTTCSWIALNQISRSEKLLLVLVGLLPGYRMDTYEAATKFEIKARARRAGSPRLPFRWATARAGRAGAVVAK